MLLNANVAFLAIPSVDPGYGTHRTPAQLASYLSVAASIGSIVTGLLLQRQHRTKPHDSAEEVVSYTARSLIPVPLLTAIDVSVIGQLYADSPPQCARV